MRTTKKRQLVNGEELTRNMLVCFTGVDGSGKSTMAKALMSITEKQGAKCKYVWGGFVSSFTIFRPVIAIMKATVFRGNAHMVVSDTKGRGVKSPTLSTLYQYLMLVDYVCQASLRISAPLAFGRNVICDRYIYDLVASIAVHLDYSTDKTLALLGRCLSFLPKPDLVFLLDLPEALAYDRKDDIISLEFLSVRRSIYLQMAEQQGMMVLDASRDPAELTQLVSAAVLPQMRRNEER